MNFLSWLMDGVPESDGMMGGGDGGEMRRRSDILRNTGFSKSFVLAVGNFISRVRVIFQPRMLFLLAAAGSRQARVQFRREPQPYLARERYSL